MLSAGSDRPVNPVQLQSNAISPSDGLGSSGLSLWQANIIVNTSEAAGGEGEFRRPYSGGTNRAQNSTVSGTVSRFGTF